MVESKWLSETKEISHARPANHHHRNRCRSHSLVEHPDRRETAWHCFGRPGQHDDNHDQPARAAIRPVLVQARTGSQTVRIRGRALPGLSFIGRISNWAGAVA